LICPFSKPKKKQKQKKGSFLDPLSVTRETGLYQLFEEQKVEQDETFKPFLSHLPGEIDYATIKPRVKKEKLFGTKMELVTEDVKYEKIEPVDQELLKKSLTFKNDKVVKKKKPASASAAGVKKEGAAKKKGGASAPKRRKVAKK
jgi:hypothetical protein